MFILYIMGSIVQESWNNIKLILSLPFRRGKLFRHGVSMSVRLRPSNSNSVDGTVATFRSPSRWFLGRRWDFYGFLGLGRSGEHLNWMNLHPRVGCWCCCFLFFSCPWNILETFLPGLQCLHQLFFRILQPTRIAVKETNEQGPSVQFFGRKFYAQDQPGNVGHDVCHGYVVKIQSPGRQTFGNIQYNTISLLGARCLNHFDHYSHAMARFLLPVAGDIHRHDFYAAAIDHAVGVQWSCGWNIAFHFPRPLEVETLGMHSLTLLDCSSNAGLLETQGIVLFWCFCSSDVCLPSHWLRPGFYAASKGIRSVVMPRAALRAVVAASKTCSRKYPVLS